MNNGSIFTAGYCDCPVATFSLYEDQSVCEYCAIGHYNDIPGAPSCKECEYPATTIETGNDTCNAFSVGLPEAATVLIGLLLGILFGLSIFSAGNKDRILLCFATMVVPTCDVIFDLLYIISVDFVNHTLFYACCSVFVISLFLQWIYVLCRLDALSYLHTKYPLPHTTLWLRVDANMNFFIIKDVEVQAIPPGSVVYIIGIVFLQGLYMFVYLVWLLALTVPLFFWFVIGAILNQFKTLAIKAVWNKWFYVWTGSDKFAMTKDIDVKHLNKTFQRHWLLGSIWLFIIQIYNSLRLPVANSVSILSPSFSFLMILIGTYRLFMYIIYKGYHFDEISFDMTRPPTTSYAVKPGSMSLATTNPLVPPPSGVPSSSSDPRAGRASSSDFISSIISEHGYQKEEIIRLRSEIANLKIALPKDVLSAMYPAPSP